MFFIVCLKKHNCQVALLISHCQIFILILIKVSCLFVIAMAFITYLLLAGMALGIQKRLNMFNFITFNFACSALLFFLIDLLLLQMLL